MCLPCLRHKIDLPRESRYSSSVLIFTPWMDLIQLYIGVPEENIFLHAAALPFILFQLSSSVDQRPLEIRQLTKDGMRSDGT